MTQEFPYPTKLFADAAKSFQELSGQNLNSINTYMPPVAQAMTKVSLEMMRFASKRAVECSELPDKLSKCQSTPDMFRVQMSFFESLRQQYAEEWFRLMELANDMSMQSFRTDMFPANMGSNAETRPNWGDISSWSPMSAWQMAAWQKAVWQKRPEQANSQSAPASADSQAKPASGNSRAAA
jgi:hypothetical protein